MAPAALRKFFSVMAIFASLGSAAPKHALDQSRIHANYGDGEFDKVIKELEGFLKSGRVCSPAESLFIDKHLAVVYSANPVTRERGRYHMFRMLDKEPGSDLLDMFVGQEVDGVFDKVRREQLLRIASKKAAKPVAAKAARSLPAPPDMKASVPAMPPISAVPTPETPTITAWTAQAPANKPKPAYIRRTASYRPAAAKPIGSSYASIHRPAKPADVSKVPASAPVALHQSDTTAATPAWKEPGVWIGGGAALAVVAFTLFYSGSADAAPGKTYVVPATASE